MNFGQCLLVGGAPPGRAAFQTNLSKQWANTNLMKLRGKCKLLHLEQSNSMKHFELGADYRESGFAEKDLNGGQ